jgi:hypothetical protein
MRGHAHRGPNQ